MHITGTHFNYYLICHRKLWLFANGIQMEHNSELVSQGKVLHEYAYPQRSDRFKEIAIEGIQIDFFDTKKNVIHEIKKTDKKAAAHLWQLKYYIYVLEQHGLSNVSGLLEYPKMRKTEEVWLSEADRLTIEEYKEDINTIIHSDDIPKKFPKSKCRNCSYFDFCHSSELSE